MKIEVIALRGLTVLPGMAVHFDVSRQPSVTAAERVMKGARMLFVSAQKDPEVEYPALSDIRKIGCLIQIKQLLKLPNNIIRVVAMGLERARITALDTSGDCLMGEVEAEPWPEINKSIDSISQEAMLRILYEDLDKYAEQTPILGNELIPALKKIDRLNEALVQIGSALPFPQEDKQHFLECEDYEALYIFTERMLRRETQINEVRREVQVKVKEKIDKNQRDFVLREQMKVIREELGDDNFEAEIQKYRDRLDELDAPKEVRTAIEKEIKKLSSLQGNVQESNVSRNYIEETLSQPWNKTAPERCDVELARQILDNDHYGLEKIKERVLEYLAVRARFLKAAAKKEAAAEDTDVTVSGSEAAFDEFVSDTDESGKSVQEIAAKPATAKKGIGDIPILCLVGPPGTGKTSIAQSVARALGKKYVRICLGGMRDEAEIRGHRRTYVGAMPGRFANALKTAGVSNPLILLDEIDKSSSDYKGDVASALLEVLDSEQNSHFRDHYIEMPLDLSRVLFIATANDVSTIPRPLLDRMEMIEVSSYTENEKFHIGKEHLIPKAYAQYAVKPDEVQFTDEALKFIIHSYTREAGVRSLERKIGEICRRAVMKMDTDKLEGMTITEDVVKEFLGKENLQFDKKNDEDMVGIVRGLAWTAVGGDTLEIEVDTMPGKGDLILTGQMKDVMKESARIGLSYVRSVSEAWKIPEDFFEKHDIHIHIPEGAVPKDGPSAGITMATGILSACIDRKVKADLAMTGEITLRGRVLPIGGLKEKLLAAKQAEITHVLVPEKNIPDVDELSEEIIGGMKIDFVKNMDQVLGYALV